MNLPININQLLNGKAVEWERLEFQNGKIVKEKDYEVDWMEFERRGKRI